LQYDLAKIQSEAMKNIQSTIISPEVAQMYYGFNPLYIKNGICNLNPDVKLDTKNVNR
jgi:hypothetical protein